MMAEDQTDQTPQPDSQPDTGRPEQRPPEQTPAAQLATDQPAPDQPELDQSGQSGQSGDDPAPHEAPAPGSESGEPGESGESDPQPESQPAAPSDDAPDAPASEAQPDEEEPLVTPGMNWFVLRVASNKEDSVRRTLLRKIKIEGFEHLVNRILVPTEKQKTIKAGKQKVVETKLYPGYVFVEMKLDEDSRIPQDVFFLIKETTGVGDFIGTAGRPSPMSIPEIEKMLQASKPPEEQPEVKMEFAPGDRVKIREGPFENMEGTVDATLPEQGQVRVNVSIFGRSTPIELEYWLIERVEE